MRNGLTVGITHMKYTPAPWEADDNGKIWGDIDNEALDGDSPLLAEMFGNGAEQRANSRLIEQAPRMFELLQQIVDSDMAQREEDEGNVSPLLEKARNIIERATA